MAVPLAMPKLGMTMREGRVISWPVEVGARVERGQTVLIIESEKTEVEIEAPVSGVLRHLYIAAGTTVPCGTLLAAICESSDEPLDAEAFRKQHDRPERPAPAAPASGAAVASQASVPSLRSGAPAATPAARSLARQLGADLAGIGGSGPGGRITREDVEAWAERRRDLREVDPGVSLEVPEQGEGEPLLLLPGFGTDVSAFARQIPALARRFRVLGVNPRGVGLSDAPAADAYHVADAAADAAAVTSSPAHVVGASLGAAVAIEMALSHAQKVRSLVLITPFVEMTPRLDAVVDAWCRVACESSAETLARALLPWLFSPRTLADVAVRERTARGLAAIAARVPALTLERAAAGMRAWSGSRRADLARIAVPVLVLAAGDDLLTPGGEQVGRAIPGARTVVIPGCGHALALEAAEKVNEEIAGVRC